MKVRTQEFSDTPDGRLKRLLYELDVDQTEAAERLTEIIGEEVKPRRFTDWWKTPPDKYSRAMIALLHPDPWACVKWLLEGGDFPRIHVDRNEPASDADLFRKEAQRLLRAAEALDIATGKGGFEESGDHVEVEKTIGAPASARKERESKGAKRSG